MKLAAVLSLGLVVLAFVSPSFAAGEGSPLDFKMKAIDGKDVDLSKYKGQVVLIVNVASKCGLTPQYKQLEEVYEVQGRVWTYWARPTSWRQEPGSDAQIAEFCTGVQRRLPDVPCYRSGAASTHEF
jgi:glutathione peroxidase